jgi:hypothetical protein
LFMHPPGFCLYDSVFVVPRETEPGSRLTTLSTDRWTAGFS